jgi:CHASE1-domain containing sensor protein
MASSKRFPHTTDVRQLQQRGFARDEIAGLLAVRAMYAAGAYREADPQRNRLEFVRWLYRQGRLQS